MPRSQKPKEKKSLTVGEVVDHFKKPIKKQTVRDVVDAYKGKKKGKK